MATSVDDCEAWYDKHIVPGMSEILLGIKMQPNLVHNWIKNPPPHKAWIWMRFDPMFEWYFTRYYVYAGGLSTIGCARSDTMQWKNATEEDISKYSTSWYANHPDIKD